MAPLTSGLGPTVPGLTSSSTTSSRAVRARPRWLTENEASSLCQILQKGVVSGNLRDLDLDSSDSSLWSYDEDSILGLLAAPPPRSIRCLPRHSGRGVVRSTVSLPRALLQDSRPGVVSSDSVSVSLNRILVKDSWASPSSWASSLL